MLRSRRGGGSLEIWIGPGGRKDFTRGDGIFFLEKFSCWLLQDWVSGSGFWSP